MGLPQTTEHSRKDFHLPATNGDACSGEANIFSNELEKLQ
jgi:hypothetical protein